MKKPSRNIVIRYNNSQNDQEVICFYGLDLSKDVENSHIYNGTQKGLSVQVFPEGRTLMNTLFGNNICDFADMATWIKGRRKAMNNRFSNTPYFGVEPHHSEQVVDTVDPRFRSLGSAETDLDLRTRKDLRAYRVCPRSPALGTGAVVSDDGGIDIFENKLTKEKSNMGVTGNQLQSVSCSLSVIGGMRAVASIA